MMEFTQLQKLEPWLVSRVNVKGSLDVVSILVKGLPVPKDLYLDADAKHLKAPSLSNKRLVLLIGVFSTGNNFERRMTLRRSWMQYDTVRSGDVAVRFFIGLVSEALQSRSLFYHPKIIAINMSPHCFSPKLNSVRI